MKIPPIAPASFLESLTPFNTNKPTPTSSSDLKIRRKRPVQHGPTQPTDLYITRQSTFSALYDRCKKQLFPHTLKQGKRKITIQHLLNSSAPAVNADRPWIYLHAMGAAIPIAVRLALQLKDDFGGQIEMEQVETSSCSVLDDVVVVKKEKGDGDRQMQTDQRIVSAIHIRLVRTA